VYDSDNLAHITTAIFDDDDDDTAASAATKPKQDKGSNESAVEKEDDQGKSVAEDTAAVEMAVDEQPQRPQKSESVTVFAPSTLSHGRWSRTSMML
jgi:hypothetical protein